MPPPRRSLPPDPQRPRVLVVDDEPSLCAAIDWALTDAGFDVRTATSGEAALAIVQAERIDVLLLDLRMPGMRGDVVFVLATAHQPALRARTLFLTGDITDKAKGLIGACGCNLLRKPFDLADLVSAVAALAPRPARDASA